MKNNIIVSLKFIFITLILALSLPGLNTLHSQATWTKLPGLDTMSIYNIAVDNENNIYAVTNAETLYKTNNSQKDWTSLYYTQPSPSIIRDLMVIDNSVFLTNDDFLIKSTDRGKSWDSIRVNGDPLLSRIASGNGYLILSSVWFVNYKSFDMGNSWSIYGEINSFDLMAPEITDIDILGSMIIVATNGLVFTTNDGWETLYSDSRNSIPQENGFKVVTHIRKDIIAGTDDGRIYKSTDLGLSWSVKKADSTGHGITSFATNDSIIIAGTAGEGVLVSTDFGETWTAMNAGLENTDVYSVAIGPNFMTAGTTRGAYSTAGQTMVATGTAGINGYRLYDNYPNPFERNTEIKFSLYDPGNVRIIISDLAGSHRIILADSFYESGEHSVAFDNSSYCLPAGVYFYSLMTESFNTTKRMIVF